MSSAPTPGRLIAGKYQLERAIAKGGMGSVWIALDKALDRSVAVKFMDPAILDSSDARGRFEREAKAAAQLQSSHVVQVYDYGIDDEVPYLVMEMLAGEALSSRLKRQKRLSLKEVADILVPTCKALGQAHAAGIVHRDMKPGNIFLARSGDDEVVKILDFGIAKSVGTGEPGEATKTGMLLGSPQYMAPEQIRAAKTVNHQADLWAVGVIAYRALTGVIPWKSDEVGDLLIRICSDPYELPTTLAPELPPAVDAFFERALARDLGKRFQSAREMASALAAIVETEVPNLTPYSIPGNQRASWSSAPPSDAPFGSLPPPPPPQRPSSPPAQSQTTAAALTVASAPEQPARGSSRLALLAGAALVVAVAVTAFVLSSGGSGAQGTENAAAPELAVIPPTATTPPPSAPTGGPVVTPATAEPAVAAPPSTAPSARSSAGPAPRSTAASPPTTTTAPPPTPPPTATAKKNPLDMELK